MRLAVEVYDTQVGVLAGDARTFDFTPSAEGVDRFGLNSLVLSSAVPLVPSVPRHHANRRRNWFAELLPEGDQYDFMLAQGGIRRGDTPAFLARYGRDVAGALQIWDLDDPTEPQTPGLHRVGPEEVRALLEDPIGAPLANAPQGGKSSLGGVQPKIVLVRTENGWAQALGGHPTTHILKPRLEGRNATVIHDEEYGSRLARSLALASFESRVEEFDGLPALVIERYDRSDGRRIHQEDFNQALGAAGNEKYQEYGGVVSLARIAQVLVRVGAHRDLESLARMLTLAVAVGNLDLHAKNLGLLHPDDGSVRLAPAYDVVPQAHHPASDGRLALSVNGVYRHAAVSCDDLVAEASSWGLRTAARTIEETLEAVLAAATQELPLDGAHPELRTDIIRFTRNLLDGQPAG